MVNCSRFGESCSSTYHARLFICPPFKLCASSGCDHFVIIELFTSHKQSSVLCGLGGRSAETSGFSGSSVTSYFLAFIQVSCPSVSGVRKLCLGGCSVADLLSLKRVQLSLARSILSANLGSSCVTDLSKSQLLLLVRWPTLSWRRRRQKLIYFWKLKKMAMVLPPSLLNFMPLFLIDVHIACVLAILLKFPFALPLLT